MRNHVFLIREDGDQPKWKLRGGGRKHFSKFKWSRNLYKSYNVAQRLNNKEVKDPLLWADDAVITRT